MTNEIKDIYITALRNTHALEVQALQIMARQVERLENYPEIKAALQNHITETEGQRDRIDEALAGQSESASMIKDGFMGFVGNMMAMSHTPAPDEILKNSFANQAFENFEIASYNSLIAIAEAAGENKFISGFQKSLQQEEAMAETVAKLIVPTTKKYLSLTSADKKADRYRKVR